MTSVIYGCSRYDELGLYMDVVDDTNKSFECDLGLTEVHPGTS